MQKNLDYLIDKLADTQRLTADKFAALFNGQTKALTRYAAAKADAVRRRHYGDAVYLRGLIELTNHCRNDCYYCGIRRGNLNASRYRLTPDEVLQCADEGYRLGFRTFVLQGGEDGFYTASKVAQLVAQLKARHPDCAVTLSLGEHPHAAYQSWFDAGADRYLLRHETADAAHFAALHPPELTLAKRQACLYDLKDIGYQIGSGFMVGSPWQTPQTLAQDMLFLKELQPQMVGIGPFIPHKDTPFKDKKSGTADDTVFMLSLVRLMLPRVLLPATTALSSASQNGQERGILAGANVIMPNLSPKEVRHKYMLYNNKAHTGSEAAEAVRDLEKRMQKIGYNVVASRGDAAGFSINNHITTEVSNDTI